MHALPPERRPLRVDLWVGLTVLLLVPLLPAGLAVWLHPRAPDWTALRAEVTMLSVSAAEALDNVLWVDARDVAAFENGHVPGAVNLSEDAWESQLTGLLDVWEPGQRLVVYCDGEACLASRQVALRIRRELALDNVAVLTGGWPAWQEAHP